jgi:hypothetical protein
MRQCTHARKGIVSNQLTGYDKNRPLASRAVCDRPACIEAARQWAAGFTNEPAFYLSDVDRSAGKERTDA